ncbi:MAG: XisI protein [Caldilineaceae bacterium]
MPDGLSPPDFEVAVAFDDEHGHYILRRIGWSPTQHYKYTDIHISIRDGKIWIEEDMTEDGMANELLARGVPHEDIVLGFQPPKMRPHTEFAVA